MALVDVVPRSHPVATSRIKSLSHPDVGSDWRKCGLQQFTAPMHAAFMRVIIAVSIIGYDGASFAPRLRNPEYD
jgi:hypothetical protein